MSPSKKTAKKSARKTAKKAAKKPAKAKKKAAKAAPKKKAAAKKKKSAAKPARKATTAKAAAKKTTAKKAATKKTATKKAAGKKSSAARKAAAPAKKAASKPAKEARSKAADKAEAKAPAKAPAKTKARAAAKKARAKRAVVPTGPRHPKLGFKWSCFSCGAKFYDLGKEDPICPKCGVDQRDRPPEEPKSAPEPAKPKVVRPMAQLLDEEDQAPAPDEIDDIEESGSPADPMFDPSESDDTTLDIEDVELEDTVNPAEIDEL